MLPGHISFKAEIKKLKYETEEGVRFTGTALIHFQIPGKDKTLLELMGHLEEKEIYNAIDRGETINLDHCYIEKFSLRDYRLTRNMDARERVVIKGFTAREALFGGYAALDFSNAVIEGEEFSLEGACVSGGDVSFESVIFHTKQISFHDTHFSDGYFNFKNVKIKSDDVSFKNCVFGKGIKDFQYTSFGMAFLSFANAEFDNGDVSFINAHFGGNRVSFKIARFGAGKVDFHFAAFEEVELSFERTEFGSGRVDFRTVEFGKGRVNFNRSIFGAGEVVFDGCEMDSGKFSFKRAILGSGAFSFEEVMFCDEQLSFYKSWFSSLSLRFCHMDGFLDLRVNRCSTIDLSNTVVRDIIDMNPHEFTAQIDTVLMGGMRLLGRFYLDWNSNHVKEMLYSQTKSSHLLRAEQFRILKENFKNLGLYNAEDKAYVEFKRCESKAVLCDSVKEKPLTAIYQYPLYWFKLALFDKAGLYATSPVRVLITMLTFFVLFSLLYYFMLLWSPADIIASVDDQLSIMARSFYHSAITFLTIGYGDHYPYGAVRWVSAIEGFFGLFLMSYFTVAFVRKILR